jgi:O-succinylbenzoic acid--CoA ligase
LSDALSIHSAAAEYPDRVALIADGNEFTYAEIASRVDSIALARPNAHRATDVLETVLILLASLEREIPLSLVSKNTSNFQLTTVRTRMQVAAAEKAALLLFTSGSSGASKGVLLSRRALAASADAAGKVLGWADDDRWLCCLPLSHIGGISVVMRALSARKTTILCEGFDAQTIATSICRHRATHISLVPTMLWRLLEHGFRPPSHLRITLMGGAALDETLATRARQAGFLLRPSYGMTETASMVVCDGHPLPGVRLRIGKDQALSIHAPMLMDGYLPPDDTENPFGGWFRTSDRAHQSQGHLQILGRLDATIISGGENIDLTEVEAALNEHPRVHASLALGVPDPEWGQRLVALVVCDGASESIRIETLSAHKRPKAIIPVDALPLLENGKVDRQGALQLVLGLEI